MTDTQQYPRREPPGLTRANLIMQLQAHYARWLASAIEHNLSETEVEQIRRHALDLPLQNRAIYLMQCIELAFRGVAKHAAEYRTVLSAAREVPDDKLDGYMRRHTLPEWSRLMEEAGFLWSDDDHEWQEILWPIGECLTIDAPDRDSDRHRPHQFLVGPDDTMWCRGRRP